MSLYYVEYETICQDTSPLSKYVMHPYWNRVVEYCPKWVAPNLLTFVGFLFAVFVFALFTTMDYYFLASDNDNPEVKSLPKYIFLLAGISLFISYTLDGIDGKQARRTGSSTPLGELFDHGIDSYTASLIPLSVYSIFSQNPKFSVDSFHFYFVLWNILVNFHLCHWEKYNTGVLFLPWGYDITMCCTVISFIISSIWGHEMWQFTLPGNITVGNILEVALYGSALFSNLPTVLWNVYLSYKNRTGYMRTLSESLRPFVPVVLFFIISVSWMLNSPGNILKTDPRPFDAEFRRFSIERNQQSKFEDFKGLLERLFKLKEIAFLVSYIDPSDQDLLPINNDDNLRRALINAKPLLRVIIQRKGDSLEELNGYGTIKPRNLISSILGGTPGRNKNLAISNPHDFRQVSAIIDVDIVPETCRRVRLLKHGSDKPLGFYIRDGTSVRVTQNGLEKIPGIFISRLVPGGLAESTGLLAVNDEVLEVNGIEVSGKTLDQVTDMMVANSSNLIITVKPANQRTVPPVRRGSFGRNSQLSSGSQHSVGTAPSDSEDKYDQDEIVDLTGVTLEETIAKDDGVLHL
ncbi:hypothetical protein FQA39_LY09560 [Lamprigera yunnana]|nr:hypothetical protein FQA39_LY09560 [Lamprigera yunnana]